MLALLDIIPLPDIIVKLYLSRFGKNDCFCTYDIKDKRSYLSQNKCEVSSCGMKENG